MRVLHLAAGNLYGGVETLLTTLARHRNLAPAMEPVFGLCFEGRLGDELRAAGVPVHPLGAVRFSRPWTVWQARRRLRALAARFDVVVCHDCWPHAVFAPAVRALGRPLVFWAHATHAGTHWLERHARRTPPDLVLANSRWTQSHLANLFPGVPADVLYLPVADRTPADRAAARREVRAELGTADDAVVIVQASRLEPLKGHGGLLRALARLADLPGWECWVAGGPQRPEEREYLAGLLDLVSELRLGARVRFLGQRSDVPRLLVAADVHCQPNTGPESFGLVFVEALYAGLPVVTAALGGALEVVDETCGILVPPGDEEALAAALRRLAEDGGTRHALGREGPARARRLCDPRERLGQLSGRLSRCAGETRVA